MGHKELRDIDDFHWFRVLRELGKTLKKVIVTQKYSNFCKKGLIFFRY